MTALAKRVYGPYARCRWTCQRGLDPVMVDDPADYSGLHMWCRVALEAAEVARVAVKRKRRKKTP